MKISFDSYSFKNAVSLSFPILCAFIPLGIGFGYMSQQLGLEWHLSIVMAVIIYAGSAEFIVAMMLTKMVAITDIIFAALFCNLRHIFYGLSVSDKYPYRLSFKKLYMIYTLSDETYAILSSLNVNQEIAFYICLLNHLYWIMGVVIGVLLGSSIDLEIKGIDFILTSLFTVLTVEQIIKVKQYLPFLVAIFACIISLLFFPSSQMLVLSMSLVILFFVIKYKFSLYFNIGK